MGLDIRHLMCACIILACLGTGAVSQTQQTPVPPGGDTGAGGSAQVPGIYVYPPLPRAQPRDAQSGEGSQNAPEGGAGASEGCRYVPRKLDLIV